MTLPELIGHHLPAVETFLDRIEKQGDHAHGPEYRHIQPLVRFAQRFYEEFLSNVFDVDVDSFSFSDKRLVAGKVDQEESSKKQVEGLTEEQAQERRENRNRELDLAYRYLELCDQLHEDLAFGYSEDDADYFVFHEETFPDWLDELADWLKIQGEGHLVERIQRLVKRYRRAV